MIFELNHGNNKFLLHFYKQLLIYIKKRNIIKKSSFI